MKMDVSKFKKISSDKNQTVLKHPRGHQIVIAHNALTPALKKQINQIPAMAEGGEVHNYAYAGLVGGAGDASQQDEAPDDKQASAPGFLENTWNAIKPPADESNPYSYDESAVANGTQDSSGHQIPEESDVAADASGAFRAGQGNQPAPTTAPASTRVPQGAPQSANDPYGSYLSTLQKGVAGLGAAAKDEAAAQSMLGEKQAAVLQQQESALQKIQSDGEHRYNYDMNQADAVAKDVLKHSINSNAYMENMSTGSKVATAIGLILGGMGGGLTGQENPAQKFLESQIQRDVDAQKANLNKSENLYNYFIHRGETEQNATKLSTAYTANIYANRMLAEAAKMQNPILAAQAKQKAIGIQLQYAPLIKEAAQNGALMNHLNSGNSNFGPMELARLGAMKPEEAQKEQGAINAYKANMNAIDDIYDKVGKLQTVGSRVGSPLQSKSLIDTANAQLASMIQAANPSERLTPESAKLEIEPYELKLSDNDQTRMQKLAGAQKHLALKYANQFPVTSQYSPNAVPRWTPPASQEDRLLNFAKQNPHDPRSAKILQTYGQR